jgi:hypothetical protein
MISTQSLFELASVVILILKNSDVLFQKYHRPREFLVWWYAGTAAAAKIEKAGVL